ncbi:hypothetical protein ACV3VG_13975 [Clostridium perfringens]
MPGNKHNIIKMANSRKKIRLIDASRAEDASDEINSVYTDSKGFMVFAVKDNNWHQWSFKKDELDNIFIQNLLGMNKDTYMSLNSFKSPKKLLSNLFGLNALWSDLDYYNTRYKNKSVNEMINIVLKNKLMKKIPPSMFISSGRGLYAIWLLESAHAQKCLPLWNKLMDTIHQELVKYGADPKSAEASHVLRLAGSTHTKNGKIAKIIKDEYGRFNPKRYTLDELSKGILPELKYTRDEYQKILSKKKKSKKDRALCKTKSLFNIHSLNYARMQDLQTIVELRNGDCEGYREQIIFLYRYWANCFNKNKEKALSEAKELNNMFSQPLSDEEVENATLRAEIASDIWHKKLEEYCNLEKRPSIKTFFRNTGCYIYSNKALIELLSITQDEMKHLLTIINTKEKNRRNKDYRAEWMRNSRRNKNGLHSREQAKADNIYAIIELLEKGYRQVDIVKELGLGKSTVSEYVKEIKEKNITKELIKNSFNNEFEIKLERVTDNELNLLVM